MQEQQSPRRLPIGVIAGFSVLIITTGSAVAWWSWNSISRKNPGPNPIEQSQSPKTGQASPPAVSTPGEAQKPQPKLAPTAIEKTVEVYWLKGSGQEIALKPVPVKPSSDGDSNASVKSGLEKLLAGPTDSSTTTTIPRGTQLKSVEARNDGIHVNLSEEFTTGGGSASMTARVAQVLYTATSLNPNDKVWLSVDGKPLEVLGGEGLILEQPLTRKSFERDFSL